MSACRRSSASWRPATPAASGPRVEILGLGGAWQNASMVFGIEDTVGYNALRISEYERAVGSGENAVELRLRQFPGTFRGYRCSLASLLGLEYLVLDRPAEKLPRHFPRLRDATLLHASGTMWIYRLPPASPRAYVATRLKPVDVEAVLESEELPAFDRTEEALIDESELASLSQPLPVLEPDAEARPSVSRVRLVSYKRNAVVLDVTTDRPGVLVLHDVHYPAGRREWTGRRSPSCARTCSSRGVEVPAGEHRVEFTFRPLSPDNLMVAAADLLGSGGEENTGENDAPSEGRSSLTH